MKSESEKMEPISGVVTVPMPDYSKRIEEERAKDRPESELFVNCPQWIREIHLRDRAELLKTGTLLIVDPTGTLTPELFNKIINRLLDG